jgi:hypothetical protein
MDDCAWSKIFGRVVSTVSLREVDRTGMLKMTPGEAVRFKTRRVVGFMIGW